MHNRLFGSNKNKLPVWWPRMGRVICQKCRISSSPSLLLFLFQSDVLLVWMYGNHLTSERSERDFNRCCVSQPKEVGALINARCNICLGLNFQKSLFSSTHIKQLNEVWKAKCILVIVPNTLWCSI